jgi:ribonuclease HI
MELLPVFTFFPPAPVIEAGAAGDPVDASATFAALRRGPWRAYHVLATDGSKTPTPGGPSTVGAAGYDAFSLEVDMFRLNPLATVYLAEALAILQTLLRVRAKDIRAPLVLTDCLSVLQALQSSTPDASTPWVVVEIRRLLLQLVREGRAPLLAWVPAHRGIPPNEAADAAANAARTHGVYVEVPLPPSVYYQAQRDHLLHQWQARWATAITGRHLFGLSPAVGRAPWFARVTEHKRRSITALTRLRLGHAPTPAHLHRCAGLESPRCSCGAASADASHLLEHCLFVDRVFFHDALDTAELQHTLDAVLRNPVAAIPAVTALLGANPTLRL